MSSVTLCLSRYSAADCSAAEAEPAVPPLEAVAPVASTRFRSIAAQPEAISTQLLLALPSSRAC